MSKAENFAHDDENDTALFENWREQVIHDFPNPDRIGCFDPEALRTIVETPEKLDLGDPKYIHIVECAECTKDLNALRLAREERLALEAALLKQRSSSRRGLVGWKLAALAGTACILLCVFFLTWRYQSRKQSENSAETAVEKTIDLSADGAQRGETEKPVSISFPRRLVNLDLVLPFYSPAGRYRITVSRGRNSNEILARYANASANGAHTALRVQLDLRSMKPGQYFLGTAYDGDSEPYYYPVTLD